MAPTALAAPSWQAAVRNAVRDPAELLRLLELTPHALGPAAVTAFPLLVPRGFVARMRRGDPNDPLLRQVWPLAAELEAVPGYTADPVREHGLATQGLVRKYHGRALLIAGRALGEPIVQYGPFVMNTREEVEQAVRDYQNGTLTSSATMSDDGEAVTAYRERS